MKRLDEKRVSAIIRLLTTLRRDAGVKVSHEDVSEILKKCNLSWLMKDNIPVQCINELEIVELAKRSACGVRVSPGEVEEALRVITKRHAAIEVKDEHEPESGDVHGRETSDELPTDDVFQALRLEPELLQPAPESPTTPEEVIPEGSQLSEQEQSGLLRLDDELNVTTTEEVPTRESDEAELTADILPPLENSGQDEPRLDETSPAEHQRKDSTEMAETTGNNRRDDEVELDEVKHAERPQKSRGWLVMVFFAVLIVIAGVVGYWQFFQANTPDSGTVNAGESMVFQYEKAVMKFRQVEYHLDPTSAVFFDGKGNRLAEAAVLTQAALDAEQQRKVVDALKAEIGHPPTNNGERPYLTTEDLKKVLGEDREALTKTVSDGFKDLAGMQGKTNDAITSMVVSQKQTVDAITVNTNAVAELVTVLKKQLTNKPSLTPSPTATPEEGVGQTLILEPVPEEKSLPDPNQYGPGIVEQKDSKSY